MLGVCSFLANYFCVDVILVRVIFVVFFPLTFFLYFIIYYIISEDNKTMDNESTKNMRDTNNVDRAARVGLILLVIGLLILANYFNLLANFSFSMFAASLLIIFGGAMLAKVKMNLVFIALVFVISIFLAVLIGTLKLSTFTAFPMGPQG